MFMVGKVFRCKKFKKNSKFPDFKPFLFDLGDPNSCYCIAYQVIYSSAGSNLNFNFHKFECGLNLNMRVKFKGGLNWQLPTAIRVKSKCGLTSRAGKMHVITVLFFSWKCMIWIFIYFSKTREIEIFQLQPMMP